MKPVSLSVHKNTMGQRERHRIAHALKDHIRHYISGKAIAGYAIVVWDSNWNAEAYWDTGRLMPSGVLPEFTKECISVSMMRGQIDGHPAA